jgi:hypothetical protein
MQGSQAAIDDYLNRLCARVAEVAAERLLGVWVVGSAATGDFDPASSDLDVQAIVTQPLRRAELEQLAADLDHTRLPCPARGLEFVLYARAGLRDERGPAFQLNLNTGPRMPRHVGLDPSCEPRFWFTLDVSIARQTARTLRGPRAADAFPEPRRALVLHAAAEALRWYAAHDPPAAAVAARRTCEWLRDGRWRSKREVRRLLAEP